MDFSLAMDNLSLLLRLQRDGQTEELLIASDYVRFYELLIFFSKM